MKRDVYSAFGSAVRTRLMMCLADQPKTVTELMRVCKLGQSAVSQHLNKLREARMVKVAREGRARIYELRYPQAAVISKLLLALDKEV